MTVATRRPTSRHSLVGTAGLPRRRLLAGTLGLVAVLALASAVGNGGTSSSGLDRTGALVDLGLPLTTFAGRTAAVGTVGSLLFAAVLRTERVPSPASRQALRAASMWAWAWAAATVVGAVLTVSRLVGVSPGSLPASAVGVYVTDLAAGRAALFVAATATVLALTAHRCRSPHTARLLLAGAVATLVVPVVLTGHSATAENHVVAVTSLAVHVVAAAVWAGGLLAVLLHGRGSDDVAPAVARFSAVALGCFVVTAASGVLSAAILLGGLDGVLAAAGTGYGWLLVAKAVALGALGGFGWWHRRRTLPRLRAGRPGSFRRFAVAETGILLATVAVAVALAGSPPPASVPAPASASASAAAESSTGSAAPGSSTGAAPAGPGAAPADEMAGHDHGELSVGVLIDEARFHVSGPVAAGSRVTVHNRSTTEVTLTAEDGSFDVVVPARTLITFEAPAGPGSYPFTSRHSSAFADVLEVR